MFLFNGEAAVRPEVRRGRTGEHLVKRESILARMCIGKLHHGQIRPDLSWYIKL